ncbi:MAG TPA: hypothetical protein VK432_01180 [Stellaceae bacterium]|nr:hypothetical protein [Stellaceae bacterium]
MRRSREYGLALVLLLAFAAPVGATELGLKRVMLSSGGVGYFEYEANVDGGDASLTLDVPLDQVDDVLKSLVVYDSGGRAGEITLPGRQPLSQSIADLPFDPSALDSATALLDALRGNDIRIGGDTPVTGQLIHAEDATEHATDGTSATRIRLSVLTDGGLRQVSVRDADAIAFTDIALQAKIKAALSQVAAYHAQGRRQLTIATHGDRARVVRVGYVVAMPLWKATYRMVLPADANAEQARLQGWAVLENFSGQKWSDVELTLLSGNPVTFRQALYESYYLPRPLVPVASGDRVLPAPDSGATEAPSAGKPAERADQAAGAFRQMMRARNPEGMPVGALAPTTVAPAPAPPPPPEQPAQVEAATADESTTQIAFTLPYKVNVAPGQSLVVPLIDRELPAHRVDLYQPATVRTHPLAAIELTNAADTGLPPGVLTLYQQGAHGAEYLGDARLSALPAGDKRLLSYAVDNRVTITSDSTSQEPIVKATIAEGVMHVTRLNRVTTTERVVSTAAPPRLIIEMPSRGSDWRLASPQPDKLERTPGGAYRLPTPLDAKGGGTLTIVEEQPVEEAVELTDLDDATLDVYVAAKELDPKLRRALVELAEHRKAVSRQQTELDRLKDEHTRLTEDEERLRDNYTAVKDDPAMRKSTLDKLKAAEAAIDDNSAAIAKATTTLATGQSELAAYISGLKL